MPDQSAALTAEEHLRRAEQSLAYVDKEIWFRPGLSRLPSSEEQRMIDNHIAAARAHIELAAVKDGQRPAIQLVLDEAYGSKTG
jgi:hypothetical protein